MPGKVNGSVGGTVRVPVLVPEIDPFKIIELGVPLLELFYASKNRLNP